MNDVIPLAIVGLGKIAHDQHIPSLERSNSFTFAATVTRRGGIEGIDDFRSIAEMVAARPDIKAVSLCTPPRGRLDMVREALDAGLDVLLEKPPAESYGEAQAIAALAERSNHTLYCSWHSRESAAVEPVAIWLQGKTITNVAVQWRENVREWHPGQEWIWEPGIGVFDPGINAMSILTALLPAPILFNKGTMAVPQNRQGPISADIALTCGEGAPVSLDFDFEEQGHQIWQITITTDQSVAQIIDGGSKLMIDGNNIELDIVTTEYDRVYRRFAQLCAERRSDADVMPLRVINDIFMASTRTSAPDFHWNS